MDEAESRIRRGHRSSTANLDGFITVERQKAFNRCMGIFDHKGVYRAPVPTKTESNTVEDKLNSEAEEVELTDWGD